MLLSVILPPTRLCQIHPPLRPVCQNAFNDLYWSSGDGGPQTDPYDHAQDETLLIGSVLRISVSSTEENVGYEIPPGNYRGAHTYENPTALIRPHPFARRGHALLRDLGVTLSCVRIRTSTYCRR